MSELLIKDFLRIDNMDDITKTIMQGITFKGASSRPKEEKVKTKAKKKNEKQCQLPATDLARLRTN